MSSVPSPPAGFLDAVGGWPMPRAVVDAYDRASELAWADPMRLHHLGRRSALFLDTARDSIAVSIARETGASIGAEQIYFAPHARQAAQWAAQGFLGAPRFAASAIETLALVDGITDHDPQISVVPVDEHGFVQLPALNALEPLSSLVLALQAAHGEIGTQQDLDAAADLGPRLLVDGSHGLGRVDLGDRWSVLLLPAVDLGGPAGLVIMAVSSQARWSAPLPSTGGWLGGRADVPAVVAAATALELNLPLVRAQAPAQFALIERLHRSIQAGIADVTFAGHQQRRLPHLLNCSILYVSGEALVMGLDQRGFAVASGSACVADSDRASHVLAAIGGFTGGNLRISLPLGCNEEAIDSFVDALVEVVARLREGTQL